MGSWYCTHSSNLFGNRQFSVCACRAQRWERQKKMTCDWSLRTLVKMNDFEIKWKLTDLQYLVVNMISAQYKSSANTQWHPVAHRMNAIYSISIWSCFTVGRWALSHYCRVVAHFLQCHGSIFTSSICYPHKTNVWLHPL